MAVKFTSAVTVATLALLATSALAQAVYRYKDSQGNTVYTDKPPAGNETVQRLENAPPARPGRPTPGKRTERSAEKIARSGEPAHGRSRSRRAGRRRRLQRPARGASTPRRGRRASGRGPFGTL